MLLAALAASTAACSGTPRPAARASGPAPAASSAASASAAAAGAFVDIVAPSHLVPDVVGNRGIIAKDDGYRRILVDRMRLIAREDGSVERAAELLPLGIVNAITLPSRLGGGFLFYANSGGTEIWRAPTWLAKLKPLVQLGTSISEIIPGFDRLYLRYSNNRFGALDPETGELEGLGPLPPAAGYGKLAIADGWRAVVDTDLRGPLATFDAGMTWRPVGITERAQDIAVIAGDPTITVGGGRYLIDAHGLVTYRPDVHKDPSATPDPESAARPPGPFGKRPLRAALEDGWPDSATTAVVARGGALARVSLQNGAILATAEEAYPDRLASCHALRLGRGIGFLCGERDGNTSVYAFAPPLAMKPVMRFAKPRFIASSGNGALVVRGGCTDTPTVNDDARAYCIRDVAGNTREVRVKGDLGVERVIALADGRVAVLVPPRGGTPGQLTLLDGSSAKSVALRLPPDPRSVNRDLQRGMWLEGFEERDKGVLGGWVEAGGPVIGVRIDLDGKVTAGDSRDDAGGAILSGRFGLSFGDGGRAAETTDGGMHWEILDLPDPDDDPARHALTRACGPAGCALGSWLRVGWGKPDDDNLRPDDPTPPPYVAPKIPSTLWFSCTLGQSVTPPPPPAKTPLHGAILARGKPGAAPGPIMLTAWSHFRNSPPPALANDEVGIDNGSISETAVRAYAWGKKGADWTRAGRWQVRFDDRFDPSGGLRQSALTASIWPDEVAAQEGIGAGSFGAASWIAFLDPSGRAVLADSCRGMLCSYYAVGDGQPVLPIRDSAGRSVNFPRPQSAVRVGETWFILSMGPSNDWAQVSRVDLGVSRPLGVYFRSTRVGLEPPRLVRRALTGMVGILVGGSPDQRDRSGAYYVLPLNPETGALGEPTILARRDFPGVTFQRCAPGQDGWVFDTPFDSSTPTAIDLADNFGTFDSLEMRVRLDPGSACIEGLAARVDGLAARPKPGARPPVLAPGAPKPPPAKPISTATPTSGDDLGAIPLSATERTTGRRWTLSCHQRPPSPIAPLGTR